MFNKKTIKLSLTKLILLKDEVEKSLNDNINRYKESKVHNQEAYDYIKMLSNQVLLIKLAINRGNNKKHSLLGDINSFWIFQRSELDRLSRCAKNKQDQNDLKKDLKDIDFKLKNFNSKTTVRLPFYKELLKQFTVN